MKTQSHIYGWASESRYLYSIRLNLSKAGNPQVLANAFRDYSRTGAERLLTIIYIIPSSASPSRTPKKGALKRLI